ncbi:Glycosyltransferase involved in cell wall bisynthesis [Halpernia humi]|uniref:Glycosyltransferase involved in cell wall bisynthesis n=1 Tax=Halpernia humi TaxID=493375 RepID=A0A1H5UJZ0_9FLAO|nr:glycosyltransferase family 4 protein [Halpernia humi]SEF75393.1 Glycosyltransferase involved in cell wall bisynthesis [Halpernia humi]
MKRKKILFISSWFPNKLEPTNGNFVQRHAEAAALYNDVEILHAIGDFNQKEKFLFDDKIVNGLRTLIVYYKNSRNPLRNFPRRMLAYKKGFVKMQKPDLVHANVLHNSMFFAVYLKKKYKIPFVITEHWTALREINQNKTPFKIKKTAQIIGNCADYILPVSQDLLKGLENLGIKTKLKVIPNLVDTSLFFPKKNENPEFTFIHISNLIPRKNADKILNSTLNILKLGYKVKLKIGGDGDYSKLLETVEKSEFKDKIEVFGTQTLPQVADKMKNADCFILFSEDENQPCVIAEAFASGIKVISTNVGGISEFFPEDFGILLQNSDESGLEAAMIEILKQPKNEFQNKMQEYAKFTFSIETIAREFSEIYEQVLK